MQVYLAVTPDKAQSALPFCHSLAHVAYRIGRDSALLRQEPLPFRGGILSLSDCQCPPIAQPERLCAAIARECVRRDYAGVLLDFEEPPEKDRLLFTGQLEHTLSPLQRTLYLPEAYAAESSRATVLICTAISGGCLSQRLEEAVLLYGGAHRLALDVQRLRMDFTLPARNGTGKPLNSEELQQLKAQKNPTVFYSPELCARYFTYIRHQTPHLVIFDDASTLREKLHLANQFQISTAFFMWPEIQDLTEP